MGSSFRAVCIGAMALLAQAALAGPALERILTRQSVVVGYSETSAPFSFVAKGEPAGYSVDLCREVVDRIRASTGKPLQLRFVPVDQDELPRYVSAGTVDLMCAGVSDTPQRRRTMAFSSPIFISSVKLLVRDDGPRALSSLKGGTVAVLGRTTAVDAVKDLEKKRMLGLRSAAVFGADAALSQLRLGQAQAWARDEVLLLGTVARESDADRFRLLPDSLSKEVLAIAMPMDADLRALVQGTLSDLARSGKLDAAYQKWFVQPNAANEKGLKIPMSEELKAEFDALR